MSFLWAIAFGICPQRPSHSLFFNFAEHTKLLIHTSTQYSFIRYLAAKKTVDDRALNAHVWNTLVNALPVTTPERPLRVLEVGAGIGTMVERVVERKLLKYAHYKAVDEQTDNIAEMRRRVPLNMCHGDMHIVIDPEAADALEFAVRPENRGTWDVLIAHAFLDLLDLPSALPLLLSCLRPGGAFYFTIVFDGATILQPEIDPVFDAQIATLYHRTMDERITKGRPSGGSRSGRQLFEHLRRAGAEVLAAGSSDWVVFARPSGYPDDEAYFLHFIVDTMHGALRNRPELDMPRFESWIVERHAQIERGELVYIAHQLDVAGCVRG
jgi:SAM-dependent methyltransferase